MAVVHATCWCNGICYNVPLRTCPYGQTNIVCRSLLTGGQRRKDVEQARRTLLFSCPTLAGFLLLENGKKALADVKIALSNMQAIEVLCPEGQTTVTGGTSFGATCFRVTGDAFNPANQSVYNADIFGRVYDAEGEPALDAAENLRIDTITEIPPGKSKDIGLV